MEQLSNVDYTSFKDQCLSDEDYYYTLTRVWSVTNTISKEWKPNGVTVLV